MLFIFHPVIYAARTRIMAWTLCVREPLKFNSFQEPYIYTQPSKVRNFEIFIRVPKTNACVRFLAKYVYIT